MPKSVFDQELKDRAIRMYHQELAVEGQSKIGVCRVVGDQSVDAAVVDMQSRVESSCCP